VLADIRSCNLQSVSWVIPAGQNSDHAGSPNNTGGPDWVAAIVNAIGNNPPCPNGEVYWHDTVIFVTWDDCASRFILSASSDFESYGYQARSVANRFAALDSNTEGNTNTANGAYCRFAEGERPARRSESLPWWT
jgi:hypothetical protein